MKSDAGSGSEVALARRVGDVPEPDALPGGCVYEPKWDGFRALLRVPASPDRAGLSSRHGTDLGGAFPEVLEAAEALPPGVLLDGELVLWREGRLDFDTLSRRVNMTGRRARTGAQPAATFVAFDVLEAEGRDLRSLPWTARRAALEVLADGWPGCLVLSPVTRDPAVAREWMRDLRPAGIEGVVVKAGSGVYRPGRRDWLKVKSYETREVIVGAVTGPLDAPETVLVGLRDPAGVLRLVGRSTPLSKVVARAAATHLRPAAASHPWPELVPAGRFARGRDPVRVVRVEPVVAEVLADAAVSAGVFRHPVRLVRLRPDLPVGSVERLAAPAD